LISSKPLVVTFHGSDVLAEPLRNTVYRACQRKVVAAATHIIAVSEPLRDVLVQKLGGSPGRVSVIPCGVDTSLFRRRPKEAARSQLGIAPDAKVVLFIGRLENKKGVDLIQSAARSLPDVQFWLVGKGPVYWEAPNCRFVGGLSHFEVPTYLNAADLLI